MLIAYNAVISVTIISNQVSPIRPVGSDITLTAAIVISNSVDAPVTVYTRWTGPNDYKISNTAQPVLGSSVNYTSMAEIVSFDRDNSGVYNLTATIRFTAPIVTEGNSLTGTHRVSVGEEKTQSENELFQ